MTRDDETGDDKMVGYFRDKYGTYLANGGFEWESADGEDLADFDDDEANQEELDFSGRRVS
jgi:hypothetical protein